MTNTRADVVMKWADGDYLFSLKTPQVDELQRITTKIAVGMLVASGMPYDAAGKIALNASGLGAIRARLIGGEPWRTDIREAIRLSLIGGGMDTIRAGQMVELNVDDKPMATRDDIRYLAAGILPPTANRDAVSNLAAAIAITEAAFVGIEEIVGAKKKPRAKRKNGTGTSTSRPSTETGAPSSEQPQTAEA